MCPSMCTEEKLLKTGKKNITSIFGKTKLACQHQKNEAKPLSPGVCLPAVFHSQGLACTGFKVLRETRIVEGC